MEWRCEWCGKPHEEDDPPCDNCGHGSFERAVAPVGPQGEGGPTVWVCMDCGREHPRKNPPCSRCGGMTLERRQQTYEAGDPLGPGESGAESDGGLWARLTGEDDEPHRDVSETMTVWACTECGRAHPRNNPPCSRCGAMTLERVERDFDEERDMDPAALQDVEELWADAGSGGEDDGADSATVGGDSTTLWVCTECGRSHPRNNPPCSRCGSMTLERREQRFDDLTTSSVGWLGAVDLKIGLGFVGAALLLVLVVATSLGIVTLPGTTPRTIPAEEVPGGAETAYGLDLATVEDAYVAELDQRRTDADRASLDRSASLDERATWYNRRSVQAAYTDADPPTEAELEDAFGGAGACSDGATYAPFRVTAGGLDAPLDEYDESALASALVDEFVRRYGSENVAASDGLVGVDVHVGPDDAVFVTQFAC